MVVDRNSELKQRLQLKEAGQVSVLIGKVLGQHKSGPASQNSREGRRQTNSAGSERVP